MFKSVILALIFVRPLFAAGFEDLSHRIPKLKDFSEKLSKSVIHSQLVSKLEKENHSHPSESPVSAYSCTSLPTMTDFFDLDSLSKSPSEMPVSADELLVENPTLSLLWSILRTTQMGSAILKKFLPKYGYQFRIIFEPVGKGPTGPTAIYRPMDDTIVIGPNRQAGEIAFVLLHEMIHALDNDYKKAIERENSLKAQFEEQLQTYLHSSKPLATYSHRSLAKLKPLPFETLAKNHRKLTEFRQIRMFRAERFAYDASFFAWKELFALYPQYYKGQGLSGAPVAYSDEWLSGTLDIPKTTLEKYLSGKCEPLARLD